MSAILKTLITVSMAGGDEFEYFAKVEYDFIPGCAQTMEQPGEADSVEIFQISIGATATDCPHILPGMMVAELATCEELQAECMADWEGILEAAAEYRAEMRADLLTSEKFL